MLFDRKLELKTFVGGLLTQKLAAPAPAPASAATGSMGAAVAEASFAEAKLDVIKTAASGNTFTSEQVGRLVDAIDFSGDKLKVLEVTRGRITDPSSRFKLLGHFTFAQDKAKAQALLK